MIESAVVSCLQIAALLYLGMGSVRMNRLQTLAKNLDWVVENREFARKYGEPVYWPLFAVGFVLYAILFAGILTGSTAFLLNGKLIGIVCAVIVLFAVYYLIDKRLSAKIPLRRKRAASFVRRTLESYVHPSLVLSAILGALLVALLIIVSFFIGKISLATFLYDMSFAGLCYCLVWVGIQLGLKEKIPHESDISTVTKINVGENYRCFSMNLHVGLAFFITFFLLFLVGLQWFGFDIVHDAPKEALHRLLGEPIPVHKPIFTYLQWDVIFSVLSIPLCIAIVRSKPFRDILSIKIKPTGRDC